MNKFEEAFIEHAKNKNIFGFKIIDIEAAENENFATAKVFYKWELNGWVKDVNTEWNAFLKDNEVIVVS